jgi:NTP pyrophosphatase (non-canonical NTP hydrolase)
MDIKTLTEEVEKVSLLYASKFGIERDADWFILKLQEELGELIQSYLMMVGQARRKGQTDEELKENFRKEIADVLAHVLLLARHHKVNALEEVEDKWLRWNKKSVENDEEKAA